MFKKENTPPSRQGVFYQLSLSQNNGPFLSKDIMHTNHKSNHLLLGTLVTNGAQKLGKTVTCMPKAIGMDEVTDEKVENFTAVMKFCQDELSKSQKISSDLHNQSDKLREDIEILHEKISTMNNQLMESSLPVLKNLMKRVKESNQSDKAGYYKVQKQLRSMEMDRRTMEHVAVNCRNRIQKLEHLFGVGVVWDKKEKTHMSRNSRKSSITGISTKTNNFFE